MFATYVRYDLRRGFYEIICPSCTALSSVYHCLILVLFIAAALPGFSFLSSAKEKTGPVSYKYFSSVMVRSGDTLTSIALRYADDHYESLDAYIEEVRATNNLTDIDDIRSGDYLIVPYYSEQFR